MDHTLGRMLLERGRPFGLMHLDLDHFKRVNDHLGHAAGDHVLTQVAQVLRREVRSDDMVARIGGDEFILIFEGVTDPDVLGRIADRVIARLMRPIPWGERFCRVSASIGIAVSDDAAAADVAALLERADGALYLSKRAGRARHELAPPPGAPGDLPLSHGFSAG
jgi:diguanylate cyclase (GGDEF)-like protein